MRLCPFLKHLSKRAVTSCSKSNFRFHAQSFDIHLSVLTALLLTSVICVLKTVIHISFNILFRVLTCISLCLRIATHLSVSLLACQKLPSLHAIPASLAIPSFPPHSRPATLLHHPPSHLLLPLDQPSALHRYSIF